MPCTVSVNLSLGRSLSSPIHACDGKSPRVELLRDLAVLLQEFGMAVQEHADRARRRAGGEMPPPPAPKAPIPPLPRLPPPEGRPRGPGCLKDGHRVLPAIST